MPAQVLDSWHKLFESLHNVNSVDQDKTWELLRTELLSSMARSLNYNDIRQTDLLKYYMPIGHNNRELELIDLESAQLEFYKGNAELCKILLTQTNESSKLIKQR